jgi:hypothetical protein
MKLKADMKIFAFIKDVADAVLEVMLEFIPIFLIVEDGRFTYLKPRESKVVTIVVSLMSFHLAN